MEDLQDKVILGIDPAIASIGYAAICNQHVLDYGVIKTTAGENISVRLRQIHDDICELCTTLKPDVVALEMPFFTRENTNANKVLRALGVIQLALGDSGLPDPIFLHQSQVKSAVAQYGAAKEEMQDAVAFLFKLPGPPRPDDAADALAIAYAAQLGMRANVK
ncbi:MAG: crossover junction endodeoxyribonuclease RuvC [Synechococcales cyanobacterium RU_4_20]|nr:crossover junction endodeoxyribonuclease RuvC [Synechococcales cyanobacterium RU_4_20]NJR67319.1 crossover junction endodeoxyribonuclease RuvC [Synechococcales cyanobacterium CRU_2_2]